MNTTQPQITARNRKKRQKKRVLRIVIAVLLLALFVVLVQTDLLFNLRYLLAQDLYTSQHRYLAKYLVSSQTLAKIAYEFEHPTVVNLFPGGSSSDYYASSATPQEVNAALSVKTLQIDGFTAHEIFITHPSWLQLLPTLGGPDGRGLTLREAMSKYHAVAGINAGGFNDPGGDGNGGTPIGLVISQGKLLNPSSYLAGTNQVMGMTQGGEWFMGDYSTSFMLAHHVKYAIQFGPELISNGQVLVTGTDGWGYAPRTIIGQMKNGTVVFWVNDGRWGNGFWDIGSSLGQVAQIMASQGVYNAFNLDGGGSATMMIHRPGSALSLVNQPDTNNPPYGMRFLPDAFLVIPPPSQ